MVFDGLNVTIKRIAGKRICILEFVPNDYASPLANEGPNAKCDDLVVTLRCVQIPECSFLGKELDQAAGIALAKDFSLAHGIWPLLYTGAQATAEELHEYRRYYDTERLPIEQPYSTQPVLGECISVSYLKACIDSLVQNLWLVHFRPDPSPHARVASQASSLPSPGGAAANAPPVSATEMLKYLTKEHRTRMQKHEKEVEKSLKDSVAAQEVARRDLAAGQAHATERVAGEA